MKKLFCFLLPVLVFAFATRTSAQSAEAGYFRKLKMIRIFESNRKDVEFLFSFSDPNESVESGGSKTIYYKLPKAKLSVYYSTGRCAEHGSKLGFDLEKDVVLGMSLDFYEGVEIAQFDLDLRRFRRYQEKDNDAIHYSNDALGIEAVGGEKVLQSLEISAPDIQKLKYTCK